MTLVDGMISQIRIFKTAYWVVHCERQQLSNIKIFYPVFEIWVCWYIYPTTYKIDSKRIWLFHYYVVVVLLPHSLFLWHFLFLVSMLSTVLNHEYDLLFYVCVKGTMSYRSNQIRQTQNEHLNIVCQKLSSQ